MRTSLAQAQFIDGTINSGQNLLAKKVHAGKKYVSFMEKSCPESVDVVNSSEVLYQSQSSVSDFLRVFAEEARHQSKFAIVFSN